MLRADEAAEWIANSCHLDRQFRWLTVIAEQEAEVHAVRFGDQSNIVPWLGSG